MIHMQVPPTFWLYMRKENSMQAIELRTWRYGEIVPKSHRIYLNSDGVIKETKSTMAIVRCSSSSLILFPPSRCPGPSSMVASWQLHTTGGSLTMDARC